MAHIAKLLKALNILEKYVKDDDEYSVSSYEDENTIVVSLCGEEVNAEDKLKLEELDVFCDEETDLWLVG